MKTFAQYKEDAPNWITMIGGEYYPDILPEACELYKPVLITFGNMIKRSESSEALLMQIASVRETWMRVQLCRVFRKYVSPSTPVEMLKIKSKTPMICREYGKDFRTIDRVWAAFNTRPIPDEALCAVLWEYKDRGQKGYDLTERLFNLLNETFPDYILEGPVRAGADILLSTVFDDYPNQSRPVDFILRDKTGNVKLIGLARYDGDRGGAQEDDRTGGYMNCAKEVLEYTKSHGLDTKMLYVNDGPGLLLGSMWDDYAKLEAYDSDYIMVITLRMLKERLTLDWINK